MTDLITSTNRERAHTLSQGVSEAAQRIPRYLLVALLIEETGRNAATEGVVIALFERGQKAPLTLHAMLSTTAHGRLVSQHLETLTDVIALYRDSRERMSRFDRTASEHLHEFLRGRALPGEETAYYPSRETPLEGEAVTAPRRIKGDDRLLREYQQLLGNVFSFNFLCHGTAFVLTAKALESVGAAIGYFPAKTPSVHEERAPIEPPPTVPSAPSELNLMLKANVIVDPQGGTMLGRVKPGDRLAVAILDRTPLAREVGRLLGIRKGEQWSPTWGVVEHIKAQETGTFRVLVTLAPGVQCGITCLPSVRVTCQSGETQKSGSPSGAAAMSGGGVIGIVVVVFGLVVLGLLTVLGR